MATSKPTTDVNGSWLSRTGSWRPGCRWKSTWISYRVFFFLFFFYFTFLHLLSWDPQRTDKNTPLLGPIWRKLCGLCEASLTCSIPTWWKQKQHHPRKLVRRLSCPDGVCSRGVSFKAEGWLMLRPLPSLRLGREREEGQSPPATGSAALCCCHEKTAVALRSRWSNSWLDPQPMLLSGSCHPTDIHPRSLCSFHSNTHTHTPQQQENLPDNKYLPCCCDLYQVN